LKRFGDGDAGSDERTGDLFSYIDLGKRVQSDRPLRFGWIKTVAGRGEDPV
jgi:hypothetical protein